jgi:hypothetical protein
MPEICTTMSCVLDLGETVPSQTIRETNRDDALDKFLVLRAGTFDNQATEKQRKQMKRLTVAYAFSFKKAPKGLLQQWYKSFRRLLNTGEVISPKEVLSFREIREALYVERLKIEHQAISQTCSEAQIEGNKAHRGLSMRNSNIHLNKTRTLGLLSE